LKGGKRDAGSLLLRKQGLLFYQEREPLIHSNRGKFYLKTLIDLALILFFKIL
jgi:hypothetical protein